LKRFWLRAGIAVSVRLRITTKKLKDDLSTSGVKGGHRTIKCHACFDLCNVESGVLSTVGGIMGVLPVVVCPTGVSALKVIQGDWLKSK